MVNARLGEWTTVTHRRHPHRVQFLNRPGNGAQAYGGRKDSAFSTPAPWDRRWTSPSPYRPVPPTSMAYGTPFPAFPSGRQRTFADVVRSGHSPTNYLVSRARGDKKDNRQQRKPQDIDNNKQSLEPRLNLLARQFYRIIKMTHHLQNVTPKPDGLDPRMISRMVETLATFISPMSPTPQTSELIWGNAKNWGHSTILILENHYKEQLEKTLKELPVNLPSDWNTAFRVATKWAYRDLPRIQEDTIIHAESQIVACTGQETNDETSTQIKEQTQPIEQQNLTPRSTQSTTNNKEEQQTRTTHTPPQNLTNNTTQNTTNNNVEQQTMPRTPNNNVQTQTVTYYPQQTTTNNNTQPQTRTNHIPQKMTDNATQTVMDNSLQTTTNNKTQPQTRTQTTTQTRLDNTPQTTANNQPQTSRIPKQGTMENTTQRMRDNIPQTTKNKVPQLQTQNTQQGTQTTKNTTQTQPTKDVTQTQSTRKKITSTTTSPEPTPSRPKSRPLANSPERTILVQVAPLSAEEVFRRERGIPRAMTANQTPRRRLHISPTPIRPSPSPRP